MSSAEQQTESGMTLFLLDAIGPFFRGYKRKRINWSKIPFEHLTDADGSFDHKRMAKIKDDFITFVRRAAKFGYNAISLDDVAHLYKHPLYDAATAEWIGAFRQYFRQFCDIARENGLAVYITTDVMFLHPAWAGEIAAEGVPRRIGNLLNIQNTLNSKAGSQRVNFSIETPAAMRLLARACKAVLHDFPEIAGIITRIGECDARDVRDAFRSRLIIRTPAQCRALLKCLLPVFEECRRNLIFRTWTVGAYPIGDLQWNRTTFDRVFEDIDSKNLIISMKYGESDFFRYLPLNKLFFRSKHRKIIELQARREYEGFGEYPSFIGWDYENYRRQLADAKNLCGISVWCQTGGWTRFRRRTFLKNSSIWNEFNTYVVLHLFKKNGTTEDAVGEFCTEYLGGCDPARMLVLLRLSDEVIKEMLYVDEFARRKMFFRRLRVPPLLSVFWDTIIVTHSMRKLLRCFVTDGEQKITQGYAALEKIPVMRELAQELNLPVADIEFQYDTFRLLAVAREYYFGEYSEKLAERLQTLKRQYKSAYTPRYSVHLDFTEFTVSSRRVRFLLNICLRTQRGYRIIDQIVMIRLLNLISPLLRIPHRDFLPRFAGKRAMGIDAVLK